MPKGLRHRRIHITTFQWIIMGFIGVILMGTLLLMLPISTKQRIVTSFHDAAFTAVSAVCVTGLVVKDTGSSVYVWSDDHYSSDSDWWSWCHYDCGCICDPFWKKDQSDV